MAPNTTAWGWWRKVNTLIPQKSMQGNNAIFTVCILSLIPFLAYLPFVTMAESALIAYTIRYSALNEDNLVSRALQFRALTFIGLISYSLYVWQQPITNLFKEDINLIPAKIFVLAIVGSLSYFCIEKPILQRRAILLRNREKVKKFMDWRKKPSLRG